MAAILPLRMEVIYCTSIFFVAKPAKQFSYVWVAFPLKTSIMHASRLLCGNDNVRRSRQIQRYNNSPPYLMVNMVLTERSKK